MPSSRRAKLQRPWIIFVIKTLLEDGDQPWKPLVERAALHVPPGIALRKREKMYGPFVGHGRFKKNRTEAQKIRFGAKAVVAGHIHAKEQGGLVERYEKEGVKYLRLTERGRKHYAENY